MSFAWSVAVMVVGAGMIGFGFEAGVGDPENNSGLGRTLVYLGVFITGVAVGLGR